MASHEGPPLPPYPPVGGSWRPPAWATALRERDNVMVLHEASVPAPWGLERLRGVVLHRRGVVVIEPHAPRAIACVGDLATAHAPCNPALEAHRRAALLRRHVARRARRLFPRRLLPGRLVAALAFDGLVVLEDQDSATRTADTANHPGTACAALVTGPRAVLRRLDMLAHPPGGAESLLDARDMEMLAAELSPAAGSAVEDVLHAPANVFRRWWIRGTEAVARA